MRASPIDVRILLCVNIICILQSVNCKHIKDNKKRKKGSHHDLPFSYIIIYKTTFFKPNCLGIF